MQNLDNLLSTTYVINDGPYQGMDQREALQEAIDWWDAYLSDIEVANSKDQT